MVTFFLHLRDKTIHKKACCQNIQSPVQNMDRPLYIPNTINSPHSYYENVIIFVVVLLIGSHK